MNNEFESEGVEVAVILLSRGYNSTKIHCYFSFILVIRPGLRSTITYLEHLDKIEIGIKGSSSNQDSTSSILKISR